MPDMTIDSRYFHIFLLTVPAESTQSLRSEDGIHIGRLLVVLAPLGLVCNINR